MPSAVRLVPFTAAHLEAFAPMTTDPDVLRYTRFPDPPQTGFPREWLARYDAGRATGTKEAFAIVDGDDDALLGVALAVDIDRATGEAELGYLVAHAARAHGVISGVIWSGFSMVASARSQRFLTRASGETAVKSRKGSKLVRL